MGLTGAAENQLSLCIILILDLAVFIFARACMGATYALFAALFSLVNVSARKYQNKQRCGNYSDIF